MADNVYRQMMAGIQAQNRLLEHDRLAMTFDEDGAHFRPLPEVDQSPCWIIAVLEIGHKVSEIPVADIDGSETIHTVMQVSLTWAIWKPSHVLGLPFLPLQYKVWKTADAPVLVSQDDVETQGYVKTNFVDIALSFIPTDVRVQTVYEVGDLEQVVRWEEMRAGRA